MATHPNLKKKLSRTSSVETIKFERKRKTSSVRLVQHAEKVGEETVFGVNTGIAELTDKMSKNKENHAIQLDGCKVMGSFAPYASLEVLVARPEGIKLIVGAMNQFVGELEIQLAAIQSLCKLAEGHSPEICCMHIFSCGGLAALWQAIKKFPEENNLHFMALKCVWSMSTHENLTQEIGSEEMINNILTEMENKQHMPGIIHTCLLIISNLCIEESMTDFLISKNVLEIVVKIISLPSNHNNVEAGCRVIGSMAFHDSLCIKVMIPGSLEMIFKCLDSSMDNPSFGEVGCWATTCITKESANCMEFVAKGGLSKIRNAMRIHEKNAAVQKYGCWAISNVAAEVDDANVKKELLEMSTVNILLDAVERFPDNEEIQEEAIFALGLIMSDTDLQITLYQMDGIRVVIVALHNFPENAVIQEHGCMIIGNLAVDAMARHDIPKEDGISVVVDAMNNFPDNTYLLEYACQALANLAAEVPENKASIAEEGGIEAILNAMRNHIDDKMIQLGGCRSLFNLSENDMISIKVIQEGGIQLVFKAMKNYPDDETIQEFGNHSLFILAGTIDRNSNITGTDDTIKDIISIMNSDIDKRNLVLLCCRLIQGYSVEVGNHTTLVRVGTVPAVVTAMKRYLDIPLIHEYSCKVLALLAYGDAKSAVMSEGGTDMIFTAMKKFQDNQNLQLICCGALAQLVKEEKDQTRIGDNEWVQFLIQDMANFSKNEEMQIVGCLVISELTLSGEHQRVLLDGCIEVVLSAIKNYPYNMDLQLFACNALEALAVADDVREQMAEKGAYNYILKAMKAFPKDPEVQRSGCLSLAKLSQRDRWCSHETNYDAINVCKDLLKRFADNEIVYREAKNLLYKIEEIAV